MAWFRWHVGSCEDGKFRVTARNAGVTVATVTGVWAMLLEDASHPDHRGIATRGSDYWAAILDLDDDVLARILTALEGMGVISVGHGEITITRWKERQFETDLIDGTNAERQRRFRQRRKDEKGNDGAVMAKRQRNGSVTGGKRPDTDTDTDTDTKSARGARLSFTALPDEWERWARGEGFGSPQREFEVFADYWRAQPGQKGVKTDWFATWRNWIRRAKEDGRGGEVDEPTKAARPDARFEWSGGDLPGLRQRLKSVTGSAWKVYLDRLVPSSPGITSGPEPPERTMAEVHRLAEQFGVTVRGKE